METSIESRHLASLVEAREQAGRLWQGLSPVLDSYINALGGGGAAVAEQGGGEGSSAGGMGAVIGGGGEGGHALGGGETERGGRGGAVRWWEHDRPPDDEAAVRYAEVVGVAHSEGEAQVGTLNPTP